jgi:CBS domain containing-hemolysin-like protein
LDHGLLLGTAAALFGEAFFSGTEMALLNASPARIYRRARHGDWRAKRLASYYRAPEYWLATTLLGTNLCVVTGAFCTESWASHGPPWLPPVAGAGLILAVLLFGEILPKFVLRSAATRWVLWVLPVLAVFMVPAWPLGRLLHALTRRMGGRGAAEARARNHWASREDLIHVVSSRLREADHLRTLAETGLRQLHRPVAEVAEIPSSTVTLSLPAPRQEWALAIQRDRRALFRIVSEGRTVAFAPASALAGADPGTAQAGKWAQSPTVDAQATLESALHVLAAAKSRWGLVERSGHVIGFLDLCGLPARLI